MNLRDITNRRTPSPWSEGDNIPWNEPEFSARMLKEHLSQDHDAASRRFETIDRHVQFLFQQVLNGRPGRVLDLGCGPGFYLERLARLGCSGVGIDFSPASIDYACRSMRHEALPLEYVLGDLRQVSFGSGFDLVCLLYGEMNVFRPQHLREILRKAYEALEPDGAVVLEPSPEEEIRTIGAGLPGWYSGLSGLFSARPHLVLEESFWDETARAATNRYYIIDAETCAVDRYASSFQAYSDAELLALLEETGFSQIQLLPNLTGAGERGKFLALTGRK